MLDFNRHFYDEICGNSPSRNTRFDAKPGKDDYYGTGIHIPQTFRIEDSDCDQKRIGPCNVKSATPSIRH